MQLVGYPARFERDPDEKEEIYLVTFRGLGGTESGIVTDGLGMDDARDMAVECLTGYVLSAFEHGQLEEPPDIEEGEELVYPDLPVAIALTVRRMRKTAGLSQAEAASRVGVGQSTYSRWENPDQCNASASTIEKIARAFGRKVMISFPEAS